MTYIAKESFELEGVQFEAGQEVELSEEQALTLGEKVEAKVEAPATPVTAGDTPAENQTDTPAEPVV